MVLVKPAAKSGCVEAGQVTTSPNNRMVCTCILGQKGNKNEGVSDIQMCAPYKKRKNQIGNKDISQ